MRDLTKTSGWRNTRARIDKEPNSKLKTINKELMHYIQVLENQIVLLEKKIVEKKGEDNDQTRED